MLLLRSFISDMEQQLQKYQSNEILRVYRGQIISNEDVSEHSDFSDEVEVIFMTGSIFRLENIFCNDEHDLKQILIHMKRQIENEDTRVFEH
jgi:uncharacterized protein YbcI